MSGSLVTSGADDLIGLWREYWATVWHHPVAWPDQRLACFITADQGRADLNLRGEPLVSDYPSGRRPFLGVLTNSGTLQASSDSGILEYNDDGHLLTIAPTRAGKGTAQIVPNLLLYAGSCLVTDIKGENYGLTHKHRSTFFPGASVLKFAPFDDASDRYNPLDFIRVNADGTPNSLTFDDTRLLAEMLIPTRAQEEFWDIEARGLITTLLFYVATRYRPGDMLRTMSTVVDTLFPEPLPGEASPFDRSVELIRREADEADNAILASLVTQFIEHEAKVRAGILSTSRSGMAIWLSERLRRVTSRSDFRFSDLKRSMCRPAAEDPAPTTLYVIIPPEYLREYRSVMRLIVGLAAVELTRENSWTDDAHRAEGWWSEPPCQVLFLLDEFPALGHMAPIEQGMAYLAGYGVQIWTFVQSLGQLKDTYRENWSTFVSNAGAASYFSMTDPDLCRFLSQQLGKTAEYELRHFTTSRTEGTSSSDSDSRNSGGSSTWGDSYSSGSTYGSGTTSSFGDSSSVTEAENVRFKQDDVALPSEIRAMPAGSQLILLRNRRPVIASLLPFHKFELFDKLYGSWRT